MLYNSIFVKLKFASSKSINVSVKKFDYKSLARELFLEKIGSSVAYLKLTLNFKSEICKVFISRTFQYELITKLL